MLGYGDCLTQWLEEHIRPALDGHHLRLPTAEVLQVLRDYCALLFQYMHSVSGVNRALTIDFVMMTIVWRFGINTYELYYQDHPDRPLAEFFKSPE